MNRIGEGAEAKTYSDIIFGVKIILKIRDKKTYRIQEIDEKLRITRTKREAKVLATLKKAKLQVPELIAIGKYSLMISSIDGTLLRDMKNITTFMNDIGRILKKIHEHNIVHGDFTPANIIISKNEPYIIDFGLASITNSIEEKALDLLLFKRSISVKNTKVFLNAYAKNNNEYKAIVNKLAEIEKRGRYQIRTLS